MTDDRYDAEAAILALADHPAMGLLSLQDRVSFGLALANATAPLLAHYEMQAEALRDADDFLSSEFETLTNGWIEPRAVETLLKVRAALLPQRSPGETGKEDV